MKQLFLTIACFGVISLACLAQNPSGKQYEEALKQNPAVEYFETNDALGTPSFIRFKPTSLPDANNAEALATELFQFDKAATQLVPDGDTELKGGIVVSRYKQVHNGVLVTHSAVIVNQKDGKIHSIAAEIFDFTNTPDNASPLTEVAALDKALEFVNAEEYAWQSVEKDMANFKDNPALLAKLSQLEEAQAPKGSLVYARDIYASQAPRLAWKFDIYATKPLSRHYIYVDAENGKVLLADAIIKHADQINASAEAAKAAKAAKIAQLQEGHSHSANCTAEGHVHQFEAPQPPVAPPPSVLGTAATRYAGTRDIYTTQVVVPLLGTNDPNNTSAQLTYSGEDPRTNVLNTTVYILKDDTRGGGVETYDMNAAGGAPLSLPGLHGTALAFVDKNNVWDNTALGTQEDHLRGATSDGSVGADEAANDDFAFDAHWGAEMVYDYWKNVHNRRSFDNKNAAIKSYTHYGPAYDNAFWNGSVMTYGDGSGTSATGFRPLTSLDVCSHEVGHGICSFTSDLVYASESGAMNEALSDIWGAAIENYVTDVLGFPISFHPFQIGEQISADNIGLRRMDNPKAKGDPDTYGGQNWQNPNCTPTLANDQCGVHSNSGVLNKWFYLVVKGPLATTGAPTYTDDGKADNGTTAPHDDGNIYAGIGSLIPSGEFIGIGYPKAEAITYLMELNLTPNATFAQARVAAINAARLLYGACSQEEKTVTDAFYAINVGTRYLGCNAPTLDAYSVQNVISEGIATNDCPRFNSITFSANLTVAQASATTITFTKTGGTISNSEWAFNTVNTITFNAGETGVKFITVKIFDDAMVEGDETLLFSATSPLTSLNKAISLLIKDDEVAPTIGGLTTLLTENFEGFPTTAFSPSGNGWITVDKTAPVTTVQWAVGQNGTTPISYMTKKAIVEIKSPIPLPGEAAYDQITDATTYLRTPQIVGTGLSNITVSFTFQAGGEPACDPACDYGQLVYSEDGTNFLQIQNSPPLYAALTVTNFSMTLPANFDGKTFYLGVVWINDANGGTTASIAIDDFLVTGKGKVIDVTLNTSRTEPLSGETGKTSYFYANGTGEIITSLKNNTSHNYGCMEVKVDRAGTAPFTLYSSGAFPHKVAGKVIKATPATNNANGAFEITLYFTEAEIAALEAETGEVRTDFHLYKVNAASYTMANPSNTSHVLATYAPVNGGGTFKATFTTGFSSFAIGFPPEVPNLSPTISVLPSNLVGIQAFGAVVTLFEFNSNPTGGTISVYIPKDSKYVLNFNPTATTVGGIAVQNSVWTFDAASNPGFYILTTTSVIPANGQLKVGLNSTFDPAGQKGTTVCSAILLEGSGGDSDSSDNQNQSVIVYTF